jgi:hypothetical protein
MATLICLTVLVGCGGKSAREQFVADGDEICAQIADRIEHLALTPVSTTPGALLGQAREYRDLTRRLTVGLAGSKLPDGPAAARIVANSWRLTDAASRTTTLARRIVAAADRRHTRAELRARSAYYASVAQITAAAVPLETRIRSYGFNRCGQRENFGTAAEARRRLIPPRRRSRFEAGAAAGSRRKQQQLKRGANRVHLCRVA